MLIKFEQWLNQQGYTTVKVQAKISVYERGRKIRDVHTEAIESENFLCLYEPSIDEIQVFEILSKTKNNYKVYWHSNWFSEGNQFELS